MSNPLPLPEPNRVELDPVVPEAPATPQPDAPPERPAARRADDPDITLEIDRLITSIGGKTGTFQAKLIREAMATCLKLIPDGRDIGELKLITAAVKELRYAYRVFGQYPEPHKVTIFGSARTPPTDPDYHAAVQFSRVMGEAGWMVITGAGGGIMEAGHVGPGRTKSFGVAIRLPFETSTNDVILGDEKLIYFRYFFTRKLMFLSQAEAVALFPGGFGTMDEAYEVLTLIQTGKASMIPIVCCEGVPGTPQSYWQSWDQWIRDHLLARKLISPEDLSLYYLARSPDDAAQHIMRFYTNYHSSRYVNDDLVIRLKKPLKAIDVERLSAEFGSLIKKDAEGGAKMVQRGPYSGEQDHLNLPRLAFTHTRRGFGRVRQLIDAINGLETA